MSDRDASQLDLLGSMAGGEPPPERGRAPGEVRWARVEAPGRLGRAGLDASFEQLRAEAKATVVLAVSKALEGLLAAAREADLDLRHLPPPRDVGDGDLARQVAALESDLRAGRRAVVLSEDDALGAFVVACALVEHGVSSHDAVATVGGRGTLGPRWLEELSRFAQARGRGGAAPSGPLFGGASAPSATAEPAASPSPAAQSVADPPPVVEAVAREVLEVEAPAVGLEAIVRDPRRARLVGAVLGAAIGDAMGHPTEFVASFEEIAERWPPSGVTGYVLWRSTEDGRRVAPYTDDTQMSEEVLRSLLWSRERDADLDATMVDLSARFVRWAEAPLGGHRAPGNACLAGCRALARGVPWREAGGAAAGGCGSVMRAHPFGLVFADDLRRAEAWAVAHSRLTHRDPIALAACAAMAVGVARALRGEPIEWILSEMIGAASRHSAATAAMMARALDEAQRGIEPTTTLQRLQGWAAHEAIAAAVYLVARHPDDPSAAILEAANTPGDSDSLATLAGALLGARCGLGALPVAWVRDLERADELIELALAL